MFEKTDDHVAKFPVHLAERVIALLTNEKDIVLDPFIGSGTTAIAALNLKESLWALKKKRNIVTYQDGT